MFSRFKRTKGKSPYLQEDSTAASPNDSSASVTLRTRALLRGTADVPSYTPDIDRLIADPSRMAPHPIYNYLLIDTFDPDYPSPEFGTCAQACLAIIHRTDPSPAAHPYYRGLAHLVLGLVVDARLRSREPGPLGFKRRDPLYDMALNGAKAVKCLEEVVVELEEGGKGFVVAAKFKGEGEGEGEWVEEMVAEEVLRKRLYQAKVFCDTVAMTEGWKSGGVPGPLYFPRGKEEVKEAGESGGKEKTKADDSVVRDEAKVKEKIPGIQVRQPQVDTKVESKDKAKIEIVVTGTEAEVEAGLARLSVSDGPGPDLAPKPKKSFDSLYDA